MINEERVKQLYKVALYEQQEEKLHRHPEKYNLYDYISKEVLKSIFLGLMAYIFMLVFWIVSVWTEFVEDAQSIDLEESVFYMLLSFVGFMVVYILVTIAIYRGRYKAHLLKWNQYQEELNLLDKMYDQEEKLKA